MLGTVEGLGELGELLLGRIDGVEQDLPGMDEVLRVLVDLGVLVSLGEGLDLLGVRHGAAQAGPGHGEGRVDLAGGEDAVELGPAFYGHVHARVREDRSCCINGG